MRTIRVQETVFDVGHETQVLAQSCGEAGGLASFLGIVRSTPSKPIAALTLEHYPVMTERALERLTDAATIRFNLLGCTIIHRVGTLRPGEAIVLVLTASHHRRAALDGCAFLIDWLKTAAPFWKKECFTDGRSEWVEARQDDDNAARRWLPA